MAGSDRPEGSKGFLRAVDQAASTAESADTEPLRGSSLDAGKSSNPPLHAEIRSSAQSREYAIISHPLISGTDDSKIITTDPVKELFAGFCHKIKRGENQFFFRGLSGEGLSSALTKCAMLAESKYSQVLGHVLRLREDQSGKSRAVALEHLHSLRAAETGGYSSDILWRAQLYYTAQPFEERDEFNGKRNMFILCLDDINLLSLPHTSFLRNLKNGFKGESVRLITLCSAKADTIDELLNPSDFDNRKSGRQKVAQKRLATHLNWLCTNELPFRGFAINEDSADIQNLLQKIDSTKDEEGRSWTNFFLPLSVANGFTLASQTKNFQKALFDCHPAASRVGIPGQAVFKTLRYILVDGAKIEDEGLVTQFSVELWKKAVADAEVKTVLHQKVRSINEMAKRL